MSLQVPEFRASKFKVTNGEFAAFVRSQGYQTRKWWSEEGWGWRTFRNVKWPTFWVLGEWLAGVCPRALLLLCCNMHCIVLVNTCDVLPAPPLAATSAHILMVLKEWPARLQIMPLHIIQYAVDGQGKA